MRVIRPPRSIWVVVDSDGHWETYATEKQAESATDGNDQSYRVFRFVPDWKQVGQ